MPELTPHARGEGVELLRTVEGDHSDAIVHIGEDGAILGQVHVRRVYQFCWAGQRYRTPVGKLDGKVAVVCGASRGIGKGVALELGAEYGFADEHGRSHPIPE